MRLIRRVLLLAIVVGGGMAALSAWSDGDWRLRSRTVALEARAAKQQAVTLANRAAAKASTAASKAGGTLNESAITAKIKSKMALDDHVKARAINIDTSESVVTLTGVVASAEERARAVNLARDTEGVSRVVDRLQIDKP
jgi:hyperosmotically inducible protein